MPLLFLLVYVVCTARLMKFAGGKPAQRWPHLWMPHGTTGWLTVLWSITTRTSMLPAAIIAWNEPSAAVPDLPMQHRLEL